MNSILPIGCLMPPISIFDSEIEEQLLKQQASELELYGTKFKQNLIPTLKEIAAVVFVSYSLSYGFAVLQNITLYIWVYNMDRVFSNHAQHSLLTSFPLTFQSPKNCSNMTFEKLFPFSKPGEIAENVVKCFQKQNPEISSSLLAQCLHSFVEVEKIYSLVPYLDCPIPSELLGNALPLSEMRSQLIELHNRNIEKYSAFYKILNSLQLIKISLP